MPIIRNALSSILGDHFPSSTERDLQRQSQNMQKNVRKANKSGTGSMVTIQALQTQLTYETVKEQRYARLGDVQQTARSRGVIAALQQQLAQYQPMNGMQMQQPYLMQQPMYQPQSMSLSQQQQPYGMQGAALPYATYPNNQQQPQQQQFQQSPPQYSQQYAAQSNIPSQPVIYSTPPPEYSEPTGKTLDY